MGTKEEYLEDLGIDYTKLWVMSAICIGTIIGNVAVILAIVARNIKVIWEHDYFNSATEFNRNIMHICFCTSTKHPCLFPSKTDDSNVLFHHPSIHSRSLDGAFDTSARNCMDCYNRLLWWQCCMQAHKICSDDWSLFKVIMII